MNLKKSKQPLKKYIKFSLSQKIPFQSTNIVENVPVPVIFFFHVRNSGTITESSLIDLPVRRSRRTSTPHSWLQDYITGSQANHSTTVQDRLNGTRYPMHHFLSNSRFDFLLHIVHILLTSQSPKNLTLMLKLSLIQIDKKRWTKSFPSCS